MDTKNTHTNVEQKQKKQSSPKYRSVKKVSGHKTASSSITGVFTETHGQKIHIISRARYDTTNTNRLFSPIDAEKRRNKLLSGSSYSSSLRHLKKPTRTLVIKQAPLVPTAPKEASERTKNWLIAQVKSHTKALDLPLIIACFAIMIVGLVAIYSSTLTYGTNRFVFVQGFAFLLGICFAIFISCFDYRQAAKHYRTIIIFNVLILLFTFFFGQSVTETTNANWIDLGFIKIQPSEFAKLLFIYSFAVHLSSVRDRLNKITTVLTLFVHAGLVFGLVLLQRDLGSLTIFMFIFIAMCFAAGLSIWYFILGVAICVGISPFAWSRLSTYQQDRIMMLFDSSIDPSGTGIRYHQLKSMTAIGNGGILGTGFTEGQITQSSMLPAKHTDMIFSCICEEFGLVGALVVLAITIFLVFRIIKCALRCTNQIGTFICVGVASMFIIQIIENVGMCLGIMPVIGITFPFLSYGGSSALSSFIAIGMVLTVGVHKEKTFFA